MVDHQHISRHGQAVESGRLAPVITARSRHAADRHLVGPRRAPREINQDLQGLAGRLQYIVVQIEICRTAGENRRQTFGRSIDDNADAGDIDRIAHSRGDGQASQGHGRTAGIVHSHLNRRYATASREGVNRSGRASPKIHNGRGGGPTGRKGPGLSGCGCRSQGLGGCVNRRNSRGGSDRPSVRHCWSVSHCGGIRDRWSNGEAGGIGDGGSVGKGPGLGRGKGGGEGQGGSGRQGIGGAELGSGGRGSSGGGSRRKRIGRSRGRSSGPGWGGTKGRRRGGGQGR